MLQMPFFANVWVDSSYFGPFPGCLQKVPGVNGLISILSQNPLIGPQNLGVWDPPFPYNFGLTLLTEGKDTFWNYTLHLVVNTAHAHSWLVLHISSFLTSVSCKFNYNLFFFSHSSSILKACYITTKMSVISHAATCKLLECLINIEWHIHVPELKIVKVAIAITTILRSMYSISHFKSTVYHHWQ